jgi:hypothetical protein
MIEQTRFLGMPLRTQRQRRGLVVGYNLFVIAFSVLALWRSHERFPLNLWLQSILLGGMLGGIKIGGPVKVYEESNLPIGNGGVQTLNLEGRRPFNNPLYGSPLDEREQTQRDRAHYTAYRILRWSLCAVVFGYWLSLNWTYAWLSTKGPVLAWILLVYVLSLPQSVVLWTEPPEPANELAEVRARSR